MKLVTKWTALCLILTILSLCFVSCIKGDRAKDTIEQFLDAVEAGNYEDAKTHLHPKYPIDIQAHLSREAAEEQLDLSAGIEIVRYSSVESAHYDSRVDGSKYETTVQVKIGGIAAEIEIELVENDNGYGIYEIDLDRD